LKYTLTAATHTEKLMPRIELRTEINSEIEIVFDLSRSIDLHKISTEHTNETAIGGKTSGLIELNESVTWRAKHFGIYQKLTSKITEYNRPNYFADEMISGAFNRFKHEHHFEEFNGKILMTDIFDYKSPLGILGNIADKLVLEGYMTDLLSERNRIVKEFAESDKWKQILTE
jgi:ligand-binding SRPBCC domain-containing protein